MNREFSEHIVYVDESGDHSLEHIDKTYPVFVLAFCIFKKNQYATEVIPHFEQFKFKYFGHDLCVLHEHEIRKPKGEFKFLLNKDIRLPFQKDLSHIIKYAPFELIAVVINKDKLKKQDRIFNPYHIALQLGLAELKSYLESQNDDMRRTYIAFERRGKKEDAELDLEFLKLKEAEAYPFEALFVDKKSNSTGLQLADLVARPIGRKSIKPQQVNRAVDILESKFVRRGGLIEYP